MMPALPVSGGNDMCTAAGISPAPPRAPYLHRVQPIILPPGGILLDIFANPRQFLFIAHDVIPEIALPQGWLGDQSALRGLLRHRVL